MLEPIGDQFNIPPGDMIQITINDSEPINIDLNSENFISIWQRGDILVTIEGEEQVFSDRS
jgi:hypothetical protein